MALAPYERLRAQRRVSSLSRRFSSFWTTQVFLHTLVDDPASNALYDSLSFTRMGTVPGYYKIGGKPRDAFVWALPLLEEEYPLATYLPATAGAHPDLTHPLPAPPKPKRRLPPWARSCLLHFGLPFLIVFIMFCVAYGLALLGPLRGIGKGVAEAADAHTNVLDEGDL